MKYQLQCIKTGDLINDAYTLHHTDNALLRAIYNEPFELQDGAEGVWKYLSWLPVSKANDYVAGTVTYKAEASGDGTFQPLGLLSRSLAGKGWPLPDGEFQGHGGRSDHSTHA